MASLVFMNFRDGTHTYGIQLLSSDKYTVENFVYNQVVDLCKKFECRYFIQGLDLHDRGTSWAFVEFFGEGNQDKMLQVIEEFNKQYGNDYHGGEILFSEPTRELLSQLKLI